MSNDKIADLKAKFVAGAIPHESDYAKLLDMLEETRVAVGTSPEAVSGSAGLKIDSSTNSLSIKLSSDGLLKVDANGLTIPLETRLRQACGLASNQNALYGFDGDTYVVAVPRAGYTIVFYFQPTGCITPHTEHNSHYDGTINPVYTNYEFKYGPGLNDGLNVLSNVFPVVMVAGKRLFVPSSPKYTTFPSDPSQMETARTAIDGVGWVDLVALP